MNDMHTADSCGLGFFSVCNLKDSVGAWINKPAFLPLSASTGKVLLATIQKAAEVVATAMLPGQQLANPHGRELTGDAYEPVMAPSPGKPSTLSTNPSSITAHKMRGMLCPVGRAYR